MAAEVGASHPSDPLATVRQLVAAAAGDTLMRDAYLLRARALLDRHCSEARYRSALEERRTVDHLLAQSRAALERDDWDRVEELAGRAAPLRRGLDAAADTLAVAEEVYDASPVVLDPFSRGLGKFSKVDVAKLRAGTLAALETLAAVDPGHGALYAARRAAIAALMPQPADAPAGSEAGTRRVSPERRALAAVERGDLEELVRLARAQRRASGQSAEVASPLDTGRRLAVSPELSKPFPPACVEPARALGLEHVEFSPMSADVASKIRAFLDAYAWIASPATLDRARDGVAELRHSFDALPDIDAETAGVMAETVSLFALHLFVNSAGLRYLPILADREWVLVESHPDGDDSASPLCRALQLDRRRALARHEIETALLVRGADVVAGIGLGPNEYRVVCIPADVYMRIAPPRRWGGREEWTHFDGYQVRKHGHLLALVGGNVRYGGVADLCGISPSDARENVVARFAIVRRERLGTRFA